MQYQKITTLAKLWQSHWDLNTNHTMFFAKAILLAGEGIDRELLNILQDRLEVPLKLKQ